MESSCGAPQGPSRLWLTVRLTSKQTKTFVIVGHTDRTGTRAYNDALSRQRADAVKDYLVKEMGVAAERLQTVGKGFSEPVDPKRPYAAGNRRVVMINAGPS